MFREIPQVHADDAARGCGGIKQLTCAIGESICKHIDNVPEAHPCEGLSENAAKALAPPVVRFVPLILTFLRNFHVLWRL
jgi:hypothetical protein